MTEPKSVFLVIDNALAAVCADFRRYEPQIGLLCQIMELASRGSVIARREGGKGGAWVSVPGRSPMKWLDGPELVEAACDEVMGADRDPHLIAGICARVFHERAWPDRDPETGEIGVRVETGMDGFSCRQCGQCCTTLDYHDELTQEDVALWERLGRTDILEWVRVVKRQDGERAFKIWTIPGTTRPADPCPFLKRIPSENRYGCLIHDVKPGICRQYPLTRKHGLMTGCRGFGRNR